MAMGAAIDSMTLLLCGLLALANVCSAQRLPEVTALNLCATAGVADFDQSGRIDISDILSTVSAFGSQNSQQDLDQSGTVDINDVLTILGYYHMDTTECLTGGGGGGDGDPPCTAEDIPIYVSPPPAPFPIHSKRYLPAVCQSRARLEAHGLHNARAWRWACRLPSARRRKQTGAR
jgi:hypothetical protein